LESLKNSGQGLFAIEIGPEGIAFAHVPNPTNSEIATCGFQPCQFGNQPDINLFTKQLQRLVSQYGFKKAKCSWVLHPSYYRLTLINTPNVPQSEYKKAIRWQIKDIISFSLEDTEIDIFYPDEPERSLKKVYVIAAQSSFLQSITHAIQDSGVYLEAIDIREFAIRNLVANFAKQSGTSDVIGSLSIVDESCLMVLVKQANIKFVRRFPINIKNLKNDNYNDLITEMQRSFNYCQTELKQEIPVKLIIPPDAMFDKSMAQSIGKNLSKEVSVLSLQEMVDLKKPIDPQIESSCWTAVGAVLRNSIQEK
jgi:MSHA biogenesis protein MshI